MGVQWKAQSNPVEKFATNIREAVAGVSLSGSEASYHEERIRYHEERIKHHEDRMKHHRDQLSAKKREKKGGPAGGGYEVRLRYEAVASGRPMQILFVDLSNTCRSPAAEAIMRAKIAEAALEKDIIVRSCSTGAGTRDWFKEDVAPQVEVERADPRMVSHASRRGLDLAGRQSVLMTKSELTSADLIIIMDKNNEKEMRAAAAHWGISSVMGKVRLLTEYCRSGTLTTDIPDPYYGPAAAGGATQTQLFEKVLDLLDDGCKGLLRDCAPEAV